MNQKPRVRFAPSPTGYLHIGGLRTALYNFLYAKKYKGDYFLRIEDTDQKRFVPEAIEKLLESLNGRESCTTKESLPTNREISPKKANMGRISSQKDWKYTKNTPISWLKEGKAYYCFCTPERLDTLRAVQEKAKLAPAYDKLCLKTYSREEAEEKIKSGEKYVIRFDIPETGETEFEDAVRGKMKFVNKNFDDYVLLKSDGYPTYHLAHVVDDHLMKTSL